MTYVEWLRVRGCLKWTAIVLVACVALVLFTRFTYLDIRPHAAGFSQIYAGGKSYAEFERESTETQTKLPGGVTRTTIDNPSMGIHMTIDDHGYWGKHVEIFQKRPPNDVHANRIDVGDIHGERIMVPGGSLIKIDEGALVPEDIGYYFIFAALAALIVATILGAPFARENEGHLEIALTKPVSRIGLALGTVAVDCAGIVIAWAMTVAFLIIGHTIFEAPNFTFGPNDVLAAAMGLLAAFGWYAMLNAATASMKRSYGGVLGVAWPVALGIAGISHARLGDTPLANAVHAVASALTKIFPTSYAHFTFIAGMGPLRHDQELSASQSDLVILAVLAIVYGALAIYQWQRVEA